jgi:hypothetical protein
MQWPLQGMPCSEFELTSSSLTHTSQNLAPVYEQLADAFAHAKDKVVIAKVDADGVGKPLGRKYDVTGYPSAYIPMSHMCLSLKGCYISFKLSNGLTQMERTSRMSQPGILIALLLCRYLVIGFTCSVNLS